MRHIEVIGYGAPPCNGVVRPVAVAPKIESEVPRRGLPIYGAAQQQAQAVVWECEACGKRWDREPLPDQVL